MKIKDFKYLVEEIKDAQKAKKQNPAFLNIASIFKLQ
jgi:hypothetical protein